MVLVWEGFLKMATTQIIIAIKTPDFDAYFVGMHDGGGLAHGYRQYGSTGSGHWSYENSELRDGSGCGQDETNSHLY